MLPLLRAPPTFKNDADKVLRYVPHTCRSKNGSTEGTQTCSNKAPIQSIVAREKPEKEQSVNISFRKGFKRYLVSVSKEPMGKSWADEEDPPKLVCPNASDPMETTMKREVIMLQSTLLF